MKSRITISLDREVVSKVDNLAGMIPRSRFIESIIKKSLVTEAC